MIIKQLVVRALYGVMSTLAGISLISNHNVENKNLNVNSNTNNQEIRIIQKTNPEIINKKEIIIKKEDDNSIKFPNLNINNFNPKIYDKQKNAIFDFLRNTTISSQNILPYIVNKNIIEGNNFRFDIENKNLALIILRLTREEDVNPRLAFAIYHKESLQGKILRSSSNARGPFQAMPGTMKENCKEYLSQYKSEKLFYSDLFIQTKAGLREIKKIARNYGIDISYNSNINQNNIEEIILILASYNAGIGNFKQNPNRVLFQKETNEYVKSIISILYGYDKLIIDQKNNNYV